MFELKSVHEKLAALDHCFNLSFMRSNSFSIPLIPARDVEIRPPDQHPDKKGLSYREGQARLLHDLANIELQAMELALRTLFEFPDAPPGFREELVALTRSEAGHLQLCLQALEKLGFQWGDWPVHTLLWQAVSPTDSLLDRILIVHRYLEGSGLDAGETLLRRLDGVAESAVHPVVKTIFTEEIGHVEFGSRWYRHLCQLEKLDPQEDFPQRIRKLRQQLPRRIEKISRTLRLQAGFTEPEIEFLEALRAEVSLHGKNSPNRDPTKTPENARS